MKLLFDQNIFFRIVSKLNSQISCGQVRELGLENESDIAIWKFERTNTVIDFITKSEFSDIGCLELS